MVLISNSGKDSRGKYSGDAAGDQNGHEWEIINWYNRPWFCVLRHPRADVRDKIAELAEKAARNDKIGYDQYERVTYWNQLVKAGYDPSRITTPCEADCSAGVCANVKATGHLLGIDALKSLPITSTHYMRNVFANAGFTVLTDDAHTKSDRRLLLGDILLNDAHHTATVISDGADAHGETDKSKTLQLYTSNGTDAQKWRVEWDAKREWFSLRNVACGLYLDVQGGSSLPKTKVQLYPGNGTDAQKFKLVPLSGYTPAQGAPVVIVPKCAPKLVLDVRDGKDADENAIQLYTRNNTTAQKWALLDLGGGVWTLLSMMGRHRALDAKGGGK